MALIDLPEDLHALVRAIAEPMFGEGAEKLYVALNGNRVYVGREPAARFRDKEGKPENIEISPNEL